MKNGFMLFTPEPPLAGLRMHPAFAPCEDIATFDAEGYAEAYSVYATVEEAKAVANDWHEEALAAVAAGDLEDCEATPDEAYAVTVHDNGDLSVLSEAGQELARYTSEDMYREAFGMEVPTPPPAMEL
jgi:hypothetical protein